MKIYVKTSDWSITKIVHETPVMTGNNYVDNIKVFYDTNPSEGSFYPTLNILKPNNRKCGPFEFDTASPSYPVSEVDDDSNTWYYYVFTLSSDNGQIDVAGKYQITITTNFYSGNNITAQRNINFFLDVKNAVLNDNNDILILGEEPDEVVASIRALIQQLSTSNAALSNSKADKNNSNQEIVAKEITAQTVETDEVETSTIKNGESVISILENLIKLKRGNYDIRVNNAGFYVSYGDVNLLFKITEEGMHSYVRPFYNNQPLVTIDYIEDLQRQVDAEEETRSNADDNLQGQIDALNAAQNLADIVADLTALNSLDTSKLQAEDKVQVLVDSNHDNASTVYNWTGTVWSYIGKYGQDSYTKSQMDTILELLDEKKADLENSNQEIKAKSVTVESVTGKENEALKITSSKGILLTGQYAGDNANETIYRGVMIGTDNDLPFGTGTLIGEMITVGESEATLKGIFVDENGSPFVVSYNSSTEVLVKTPLVTEDSFLTSSEEQDILDDIEEVFA